MLFGRLGLGSLDPVCFPFSHMATVGNIILTTSESPVLTKNVVWWGEEDSCFPVCHFPQPQWPGGRRFVFNSPLVAWFREMAQGEAEACPLFRKQVQSESGFHQILKWCSPQLLNGCMESKSSLGCPDPIYQKCCCLVWPYSTIL